MTQLVSWLVGALAVVGMFLLLIGPHEAGHFAFAKLFRVNVLEFSLGMGTRLWSATRKGTLYALRLLPIGGYVRLGGMEPGDYETPNGFHSKAAWQRILVLLAGPGVNFLMAALIVTGLAFTQLNASPGKVVAVVVPSPAYAAGIRPGDQIVSIDGRSNPNPQDVVDAVARHPGLPLAVTIRHPGGSVETLSLTPEFSKAYGHPILGLSTEGLFTPGDALITGVTFPYHTVIGIAGGIVELASHYPMSFAAVQKHIAILERAGLVAKERVGRRKVVRTNLEQLRVVRRLLDQYEELWRGRLDRMAELIADTQEADR